MAAEEAITRIVWQYTAPLAEDTMSFLRGIAADCAKVKNCVYERYSGIKSLARLTPVYGILTEMRGCGLRAQLNLPVVYYELAVADAVADIKAMWGVTKNRIRARINANANLGSAERQYVRTVLRFDGVLAAILARRDCEMPRALQGLAVDRQQLDNLIRRLVRAERTTPQVHRATCFRLSPAGYKYKDGALLVASRIKRRRIALPLRDSKTSERQIQIHLRDGYAAIALFVDELPSSGSGYCGTLCLHIGYRDMCTLPDGRVYGQALASLVTPETVRLAAKNRERARHRSVLRQSSEAGDRKKAWRIAVHNLGWEKYYAQKQRARERTQNYINAELNRLLAEEKPARIVIAKFVRQPGKMPGKASNVRRTRSFRAYTRQRLLAKCRRQGIALVEVSAQGTGSTCSRCGAPGECGGQGFRCSSCGYEASVAQNAARNIAQKARALQLID